MKWNIKVQQLSSTHFSLFYTVKIKNCTQHLIYKLYLSLDGKLLQEIYLRSAFEYGELQRCGRCAEQVRWVPALLASLRRCHVRVLFYSSSCVFKITLTDENAINCDLQAVICFCKDHSQNWLAYLWSEWWKTCSKKMTVQEVCGCVTIYEVHSFVFGNGFKAPKVHQLMRFYCTGLRFGKDGGRGWNSRNQPNWSH